MTASSELESISTKELIVAKILLVEDDQNLADMMRDHLLADHHAVENAYDGETALALLKLYSFDVVLLDKNLPCLDGVSVCRRYRMGGGNARVLMVTGLGQMQDKEAGFEAGADDYLTKPFNTRELVLRIRALLRRPFLMERESITVGTLTINPHTFTACVNGVELHLTPKEFALLEFLARYPGQVFSTSTLIERIWPSDTETGPENIKVYVYRLRAKLGSSAGTPSITSVRWVGYKLELPEGPQE